MSWIDTVAAPEGGRARAMSSEHKTHGTGEERRYETGNDADSREEDGITLTPEA